MLSDEKDLESYEPLEPADEEDRHKAYFKR